MASIIKAPGKSVNYTLPDRFVNETKLMARLDSIYGETVKCTWTVGKLHIENAPRRLNPVRYPREVRTMSS